MTLEFAINGTPLPVEAILENPDGGVTLPSSAWYGEVSTATIKVDDPFGDYDFRAWDVFTADEAAATNSRIFTGWIMTASMGRGPYRDGPARVWELEIIDQNAALGFNFFRANSAQRPSETDLARVEFILESEPMAWTPVVAGPLTNLTDNPVNLQSYDMVRVTPVEALTTTAGHAGKTFHVFWNHDDAELQLYYDQIANYPAAAASISNVIADAGADVYYPFIDANLTRAGDQVYTGELIDFVGGSAFGESATTIDRLSPTPLSPVAFKRAFMRRSDAIGRLETANAIIQNDLASQATEENTIQVTIRVPAANVNDIEAGQRVTVKFTHLQGYESDTDVNCIRRDVSLTEGRRDMYDVTLELSDKAKLRELDGGDPDDLPPVEQCDVASSSIVQEVYAAGGTVSPSIYDATWDTQPTPGNLLVAAWFTQVNPVPTHSMSGWTFADDATTLASGGTAGSVIVYYKIAGNTESLSPQINLSTSLNLQSTLQEWSGVDTFDTVNTVSVNSGASGQAKITHTPTAGVDALVVAYLHAATVGGGTVLPSTPMGATIADDQTQYGGVEALASSLHLIAEDASGGYLLGTDRAFGTASAGVSVSFTCSGSDTTCLAPGQPSIEDEPATPATGDGTTTTFATGCPFADNSLHVKVDNLNQDAAVVSYDGAAGEFTLGFAPKAGEQVTTNYLGRGA